MDASFPVAYSVTQSQCNSDLDSLATQLATAQATFRLASRRYWQGGTLLAAVPANGASVSTDSSRRSGAEASWTTFGVTPPASMSCQVQVHPYKGPYGDGYSLLALVDLDGSRWQKVIHVGPEIYRDRGWEIVGTGPT